MEFRYFNNREEMLSVIGKEPNEWKLMTRNAAYGKCIGFYDNNKLVGCSTIAIYNDGELHIHLFEIKDEYQGYGYGRESFNMLIEHFRDSFTYITLEYIDYDARSFWEHIGFTCENNNDSNETMIMHM